MARQENNLILAYVVWKRLRDYWSPRPAEAEYENPALEMRQRRNQELDYNGFLDYLDVKEPNQEARSLDELLATLSGPDDAPITLRPSELLAFVEQGDFDGMRAWIDELRAVASSGAPPKAARARKTSDYLELVEQGDRTEIRVWLADVGDTSEESEGYFSFHFDPDALRFRGGGGGCVSKHQHQDGNFCKSWERWYNADDLLKRIAEELVTLGVFPETTWPAKEMYAADEVSWFTAPLDTPGEALS